MAPKFPFEINADKYSRQLWSKQAYLYLAEFFRKAVFDSTVQVIEGGTIDDYRFSGPAEDWRLPCGGGGGGSIYSSYFRVIDASTYDASGNLTACKIGVTGGGDEATGNCGVVKVNGYIAVVAAATETITAAGTYRVWLHMWEDAVDGVSGEIIFNSQGVTTRPDNPNGGVAFSSQLVGDVTVTDNDGDLVVTDIVQHYLRGGEHVEYLWGDCVQGEV